MIVTRLPQLLLESMKYSGGKKKKTLKKDRPYPFRRGGWRLAHPLGIQKKGIVIQNIKREASRIVTIQMQKDP